MRLKIKRREPRFPALHDPLRPYASNYDLHEMAGGLPLRTITAPNIHHMSKHRREVCKQVGKSNIPNI